MRTSVILLILCLGVFGLAAAEPLDREQAQECDAVSPTVRLPIWTNLQKMTLEEKANSQIDIELPSSATATAHQIAHEIEALWNNGQYNEAIAKFDQLAQVVDIDNIAIGNTWREPIETQDVSLWGHDVRIGARDSIYETSMDIYRASGFLFATLTFREGSYFRFSVNRSVNNGSSWSETYAWSGDSIFSVSASVLNYHCLVAYSYRGEGLVARLRRFTIADGVPENFNNGETFIDVYTCVSPDSIKEVSLVSNQDYYNNRLYYSIITKQGNLYFLWDDSSATSWDAISTGVTNAKRGLSVTCNEGFADYYAWISYINTNDSVYIGKIGSGVYSFSTKARSGSGATVTSISAYGDTITCAYDYYGSLWYCRYQVSYNGGTNWYWGLLGDSTTTSESPALAARDGGGVGVVYRYYTSTRQERYTWRNYAGGWTTPVAISDNEPYWNRPSIEYLGNNGYGVIYLTTSSPYIRAAYFDYSTATGIDQNATLPRTFMVAQNYPNPFNTSTCINYELPKPTNVTISVFDVLGRKVATIYDDYQQAGQHSLIWNADQLSSGMYFAKISTDNETQTLKMMLLK